MLNDAVAEDDIETTVFVTCDIAGISFNLIDLVMRLRSKPHNSGEV